MRRKKRYPLYISSHTPATQEGIDTSMLITRNQTSHHIFLYHMYLYLDESAYIHSVLIRRLAYHLDTSSPISAISCSSSSLSSPASLPLGPPLTAKHLRVWRPASLLTTSLASGRLTSLRLPGCFLTKSSQTRHTLSQLTTSAGL